MPEKSEQLVEHLFRVESGKLVATLTRLFGSSQIQLAEDIVQDTLISALHHWSTEGIPNNPTGWLVQVAKRKALNELKRNQMKQKHHSSGQLNAETEVNVGNIFLQNEIEDSQLRMIFTCCHPSLNIESQIALTLKTLCGFGVNEVAGALLSNSSTINKRLYRAKQSIKESEMPFDIPQGKELDKRLDTVCLTLYLLFNEGYNSSTGDVIIQKELCLEAIRLTKLLVEHFPKFPNISALLALMCFHVARFDARIDNHGAIILFEDQDRTKWKQPLIHAGMRFLEKSKGSNNISAYHIEAYIAALHCTSKSFETTDWKTIYDQYFLLYKIKPNPVIKLNLAIIKSQIDGIEPSLEMLHELTNDKSLSNYHLLPATQGVFHMKLGRYAEAIQFLEKAIKLKPSSTESKFIKMQMAECEAYLKQ